MLTAYAPVSQTIGGALYVSAGEVALSNTLLKRLPITVPELSAQKVIATGVTELRSTFAAEFIPGIVDAYMSGLRVAFAIAIASAGTAVVVSLASRWRNLKGANVTGAV